MVGKINGEATFQPNNRYGKCPSKKMEAALKILIADDDQDGADTTALLLQMHGYEVLTVYNGRQAVDAARTFQPAVAILDIMMPLLNGYEAASALRKEHVGPGHLVLIANTALTQSKDVEFARRAGFDFYIGKPMDGEKLCALIDAVQPREAASPRM